MMTVQFMYELLFCIITIFHKVTHYNALSKKGLPQYALSNVCNQNDTLIPAP